MDAHTMMTTATVLLLFGALGGLTMAALRFRGADHPPSWLAMLHGFIGAAALTLLIYAWVAVGLPSLAKLATAIFLIASLGGVWLNLRFHVKHLPLPKGTVVAHGIVALTGFILLLVSLGQPIE